ncbi:hypothetical protein RJ639_019150 [Escallonia herrerae]|uniref:Stigma-specific Stig1 family protein n=1 Tax=Escallonia herrerae TaxID=1293975 RepID=A0AA89AIQ1_9ASTE|nr:hypothetical protein RJ639_019150 [Escallonia herrerae]
MGLSAKELDIDFVISTGDNFYDDGLTDDLDSALKESNAKWKIVVGHHTIKSAGHHGNTKELIKQLLPVIQCFTQMEYIQIALLWHLMNMKGQATVLPASKDLAVAGKDNPILQGVQQNATNGSSTSSPWLRRVKNPRAIGCWNRPWICNEGEFPPRIKMLCCRNRCVDVTSDPNNCGLCGIRCPFNWRCCRGLCIDTNVNPFHCGSCDHKCPFMSYCVYGMCGYAQPILPPFPFPPHHPKPPRPPFPFPPHPPKPPRPPFPFLPHQPKPPHPPKRGGQPPPSD